MGQINAQQCGSYLNTPLPAANLPVLYDLGQVSPLSGSLPGTTSPPASLGQMWLLGFDRSCGLPWHLLLSIGIACVLI